jgi:hypothetical protein
MQQPLSRQFVELGLQIHIHDDLRTVYVSDIFSSSLYQMQQPSSRQFVELGLQIHTHDHLRTVYVTDVLFQSYIS